MLLKEGDKIKFVKELETPVVWRPIWIFIKYSDEKPQFQCVICLDESQDEPFFAQLSEIWFIEGRHV